MTLQEILSGIVPADRNAMDLAQKKWDSVGKPLGSLGELEHMVVRMAGVFGTPEFSIGENLYMAKVFFSTDELFAWTAVVILLSVLFEKGILWILRKILVVKA